LRDRDIILRVGRFEEKILAVRERALPDGDLP
jgi:hypothetical protein